MMAVVVRKKSCSQVSDAGLPDSGGDGLHSRADGVQQVGEFSRPLGLPALLQHKPGEGQDVGVEGRFVGHLAFQARNRGARASSGAA